MKSKEINISGVKAVKPSDKIKAGELASDNDMAQINAAVQFAEKNRDRIVFTKKYMAGQKRLTAWKLETLRKGQPSISLKDAISTILGELPESVTPEMILEITRHLITEWERKPSGRKSKIS